MMGIKQIKNGRKSLLISAILTKLVTFLSMLVYLPLDRNDKFCIFLQNLHASKLTQEINILKQNGRIL